MLIRIRATVLLLASLTACHGSPPQAPVPDNFSRLPFQLSASADVLPASDQELIYARVLDFFRPAGSAVREIDAAILPAAAADSDVTLDSAMVARLVQSLGSNRYCFPGSLPSCLHHRGGRLRLSPVHGLDPDRARVAVHFQGKADPYGPGTMVSETEVFLVGRVRDSWRILAHAQGSGVVPTP